MKLTVAVAIWLSVLCSTNAAAAAATAGAVDSRTQQLQAPAVTREPQPAAATAECVLSLSGRTEVPDRFYGTAQMTCTGGGQVYVALAPQLEGFEPSFRGVQFRDWDYVSLGKQRIPCPMVLLGDTCAVFVRSKIVDVDYQYTPDHNPPILCVVGNSQVTFNGISVKNNKGTGLVVMDNATVLITDSSRFINTTSGQAAVHTPSAIVAADQAHVTITGKTRVQRNESPGCGGGVHVRDHAKLNMAGAIIDDNIGFSGGGICASDDAQVTICCGSLITNNRSYKPGGCHDGILGGGDLPERQCSCAYDKRSDFWQPSCCWWRPIRRGQQHKSGGHKQHHHQQQSYCGWGSSS
jgi:hypothetical protein